MNFYQTKAKKLSGKNYAEIKSKADVIFKQIKAKTKRRPYVRSAYFKKEKIFFDYFWSHLAQKSFREKERRLKYFPCAIELIKNSRNIPNGFSNPNKREYLYRFGGITKNGEGFYVQIKEDKNKRKYLMSVFPK